MKNLILCFVIMILLTGVQSALAYEIGSAPPPITLPNVDLNTLWSSEFVRAFVNNINQVVSVTPLFNIPLGNFKVGNGAPVIIPISGGGVIDLSTAVLPQLYKMFSEIIRNLIQQVFIYR